jgi:putative nucleotidyltransferase with HDIG domain
VTLIRRAALLHDIGKLGVSNTILDKPGKLTPGEWDVVRKHPQYSYEILKRISNFSELSEIAASHHEKLNGTGYFRGMAAEQLNLPSRILAVADIYDALAAKRPYRDALPLETVLDIMQKDAPHALDGGCVEALKCSCGDASSITSELYGLSLTLQQYQAESSRDEVALASGA